MVKKKKILHIISGDIWAGAEVQVFFTLLGLISYKNVSIKIVNFNDGILSEQLRRLGIDVIVLDEKKTNDFKMILKLTILIKKLNPDIVHVHNVKEHFLVSISKMLFGIKSKVIRTVHGRTKVPKRVKGIKWIRGNLVVRLNRLLLSFNTDTVILVSNELKAYYSSELKKTDIVIINNSISLSHFSDFECNSSIIRSQYGVGANCYWIGTAARLVEPKNIEMLIDTGKELKKRGVNYKISIFGEGPLYNKLKEKIIKNNLQERISLHGFVKDIYRIVRCLDVFVLTSIHEGLPMALLEAMALSTPTICTSVGGILEVIENGINGILVESGNVVEMANAIEALKSDPGKETFLTKNALDTIQCKFTIAKNIEKLKNVYFI